MVLNFKKVFLIFFYIFLFFFFLYNSFSYLDPDLGWHLKTGEWIVTEQALPYYNHFNYTINNQNWIDHEWLLDAFSYIVYENFGYIALSVFFALLITGLLALWHLFIQKNYTRSEAGFAFLIFLMIWGTLAIRPHTGVRMQEIGLLNLVLLLIILFYYQKSRQVKVLLFLPLLFYFWATVHASFLIGIFLLVLFLGVKVVENILKRVVNWKFIDFKRTLSGKEIFVLAFFSFISVVVTFLTPYGAELYVFLKSFSNTYYLTHINEWLGQYYLPFNYYQLLYLAFGGAILFLYVFDSFNRKNNLKINLWHLSIFVLFFFLAFTSRRHFPLFFIASLPILISYLDQTFSFKMNFFHSWNKGALKGAKIYLEFCLIFFLTIGSFSAFSLTNFTNSPFEHYCRQYPCGAVKFFKNSPKYEEDKLLNKFGWGGYLIWTYPEKKLFIDGRFPHAEFKGHTILEEYVQFFDKEKQARKIEESDFRLVLIHPREKKNHLDWLEKKFFARKQDKPREYNKLAEFFINSNDWEIIYQDQAAIVFFQKN